MRVFPDDRRLTAEKDGRLGYDTSNESDTIRHRGHTMTTDTEIKSAGFRALVEALGEVDAEKFIALIQREPFDYTQWQKLLWPDKTIEQISDAAMQARKKTG